MLHHPNVILGVSFGHGDSSAALIVGGQLVAAAEEERFNRIKHYALFPTQAVKYCLNQAGLSPSEVEVIAIGKKPWNQFFKKVPLLISHPHLLKLSRGQKNGATQTFSQWLSEMGLSRTHVRSFEHHLAHMMSSRFLSEAETQAFLSFDGLGDFVSAAIGMSTPQSLKILDRVVFPHSLGFFYSAMTQYLGFPYFGDEFKVMGLSSLGKPRFHSEMKNLIREVEPFGFRLNIEAFPILKSPELFYLVNGQPHVQTLYSPQYLTAVLGISPRKNKEPLAEAHWDLAKSVQLRFEEIANHLLRHLESKVPVDTLALSGGCAHNSVWVGKIIQNSRFRDIQVAPASHDAGIAVGAAMAAYGAPVTPSAQSSWSLLGPQPQYSKSQIISQELQEHVFSKETKLAEFIADELSQGKIIGVARGRLEFGPRALGNRSILADPRDFEMKDRLNARVKHRESFRPFAASVLMEYQEQWFENSFYAPTMEAVFQVRSSMKSKIPGVVHVDGSCRIQSVTHKHQPFYWNLIEAFRKRTGIPMLINTSFNDSEPIVLSADDAVKCFLSTEMDYLLLENRLFSKKSAAIALTA
ncbi:MAG: carbamoyltransferase [Proteobacteria bacterium]|nr:carbamoyltransferase [Pseudomonadota bacterium]NDC23701.1 carbamoyltransferase [Pseudomonadota bacterium]NDD03903.1 carbamoyltransferase [Pseudomonadota bacterium]NDG26278.1 carbamoyltransferase [Pseudomonadota bacterium]